MVRVHVADLRLKAPIALAARRLLDAQWHERTAKLASLDGEVERRRAELKGAEIDVERFVAVLPLLRDRYERWPERSNVRKFRGQ